VGDAQIWRWPRESPGGLLGAVPAFALAVAGGAALGGAAVGYVAFLHTLPGLDGFFAKQAESARALGELARPLLALHAVMLAPLPEEYLFRGLLFRALDREWGGARAVVGSALYFAIFHPPIAWPPVIALGIGNALLFKRSGRLAPCVVAHVVYNAIVVYAS
jgi:membrane protease YdiL (CAAX protease family)